METILKISQNKKDLAKDLAADIATLIKKKSASGKTLTIALSGGSTPALLFRTMAEDYNDLPWQNVHFFWGDERCVPPHDKESNFGMTNTELLQKIKIPVSNIHRIRGENDPGEEAARYSEEIIENTLRRNNLPAFDLIILGLGDDGHTASIFPGREDLFKSEKICEVAVHPGSGQKRITLTGPVINNADAVVFLVSGASKAQIVSDLIDNPGISDYPAALVEPVAGNLKWYLDLDAASMLSQWA